MCKRDVRRVVEFIKQNLNVEMSLQYWKAEINSTLPPNRRMTSQELAFLLNRKLHAGENREVVAEVFGSNGLIVEKTCPARYRFSETCLVP